MLTDPNVKTRKRFRDCSLRVFALGMQASHQIHHFDMLIILLQVHFDHHVEMLIVIILLQAHQLEEETRKLTNMLDRFRINASQVTDIINISIIIIKSK